VQTGRDDIVNGRAGCGGVGFIVGNMAAFGMSGTQLGEAVRTAGTIVTGGAAQAEVSGGVQDLFYRTSA
jgi:hypothetical protein